MDASTGPATEVRAVVMGAMVAEVATNDSSDS